MARVGVGPFGAAGFRVVTQGFEAGDDGSRPSDENWIPIGLERAGWPREVRSSPIAVDESPAIGRTGELPAVVRVVPGVVDYGDRPSVRTFPSTADAVSGAVSARRYLRTATTSPAGRPLSP
ncbi:hypothetical protein DVR14_05920 [Natrinema thermotolerans]|nr:hypothetical protein DVR14_05920 [Natrinema thermotolerans]